MHTCSNINNCRRIHAKSSVTPEQTSYIQTIQMKDMPLWNCRKSLSDALRFDATRQVIFIFDRFNIFETQSLEEVLYSIWLPSIIS